MAFSKQTVRDLDVKGKTVLLRADYNVPIEDGKITNDLRIRGNLPTLEYLLEHGAGVVICSHLGRPDGKPNLGFSLRPVAQRLSGLLKKDVKFVDDCVSEEAQKPIGAGQIVLLENLRFYAEEEANDKAFAQKLAAGKDIYVDDAFGVVHHPGASLVAVAEILPGAAGFLLEKEVDIITDAMENPRKPLVAVLGGAKIADKIELMEAFLGKAESLLIGGAMANTFFVAKGLEVGASKYDADDTDEAKRIVRLTHDNGIDLILADQDIIIGKKVDKDEPAVTKLLSEIASDDMILDIGPKSLEKFNKSVQSAGTVIWNGTLGITELEQFAEGSRRFAESLAASGADVIIGGGDTAGFIDEIGMLGQFKHVSTGGGASLELMAGKKLPGVEALPDK